MFTILLNIANITKLNHLRKFLNLQYMLMCGCVCMWGGQGNKYVSSPTHSLQLLLDPQYLIYLKCWRGTLYDTGYLFQL